MLQRSNLHKLSSGTVTALSDTAMYRFCIAFAVFVFVADTISFVGHSEYTIVIKYIYTAIILLLISISLWRWRSFDTKSAPPILALVFFFITGAAFLANLILYDTTE